MRSARLGHVRKGSGIPAGSVVLLTTLPLRHKTPPSPRASDSLFQSFVFFPPPTSSFVVSYCVFSITPPLVSTLVAVSCLDFNW